jgi:hypothetical protein
MPAVAQTCAPRQLLFPSASLRQGAPGAPNALQTPASQYAYHTQLSGMVSVARTQACPTATRFEQTFWALQ